MYFGFALGKEYTKPVGTYGCREELQAKLNEQLREKSAKDLEEFHLFYTLTLYSHEEMVETFTKYQKRAGNALIKRIIKKLGMNKVKMTISHQKSQIGSNTGSAGSNGKHYCTWEVNVDLPAVLLLNPYFSSLYLGIAKQLFNNLSAAIPLVLREEKLKLETMLSEMVKHSSGWAESPARYIVANPTWLERFINSYSEKDVYKKNLALWGNLRDLHGFGVVRGFINWSEHQAKRDALAAQSAPEQVKRA